MLSLSADTVLFATRCSLISIEEDDYALDCPRYLLCAESVVSNRASSLDEESLVSSSGGGLNAGCSSLRALNVGSSSRGLNAVCSSLRGLNGGVSSDGGLDRGGEVLLLLLAAGAFFVFLGGRIDTYFSPPIKLLGLGLGHCPLGRPLYNAHTGPDWPVGGGSSFMKHGMPCCWLVVK